MIRKIFRNLPETNSSSSHTLIIDTEDIGMTDIFSDNWNLEIKDNVIKIPIDSRFEFGRGKERYNDVYNKLVYAYCSSYFYNRDINLFFKDLALIKKVLLDFTGAKDVVFDWLFDFYKTVHYQKVSPSVNDFLENEEFRIPGIDHQSIDKYLEIFENENTLKNYLFNKNSWLFVIGDEFSLTPSNINIQKGEQLNKDSGGFIRIHVGKDLGDIDINFEEYPCNIELELSGNSYDLLNSIVFDKSGNRIINVNNLDENNILSFLGLVEDKIVWATERWKNECILNIVANNSRNSVGFKESIKNLDKKLKNESLKFSFNLYSNEFGLCY